MEYGSMLFITNVRKICEIICYKSTAVILKILKEIMKTITFTAKGVANYSLEEIFEHFFICLRKCLSKKILLEKKNNVHNMI